MNKEREYDIALKAAGHVPVLNEDGQTDFVAYAPDGHNGPRCSVCGDDWCMWCTPPDKIAPCIGVEAAAARDAKYKREREDRILAEAEEIKARRSNTPTT
jgi:hypothetical protein